MKNEQKTNGFTIIEMAFYVSVLIFIVFTLFNVFIWNINIEKRINAIRDSLSALRHVSDVLYEEVSSASEIYMPTSGPQQLSIITDRNPPPGESLSYVDFYACGDNFCRKRDGSAPEPLLPDSVRLSNLDFIFLNASSTPAIKMDLGLESGQAGLEIYQEEINTSITVSLRAY